MIRECQRYDLSSFKFPDQEMLMAGNIFYDCEFQVLKLI